MTIFSQLKKAASKLLPRSFNLSKVNPVAMALAGGIAGVTPAMAGGYNLFDDLSGMVNELAGPTTLFGITPNISVGTQFKFSPECIAGGDENSYNISLQAVDKKHNSRVIVTLPQENNAGAYFEGYIDGNAVSGEYDKGGIRIYSGYERGPTGLQGARDAVLSMSKVLYGSKNYRLKPCP